MTLKLGNRSRSNLKGENMDEHVKAYHRQFCRVFDASFVTIIKKGLFKLTYWVYCNKYVVAEGRPTFPKGLGFVQDWEFSSLEEAEKLFHQKTMEA